MAGQQLWTTGPCQLSIAVSNGGVAGSFQDLGYAERAPSFVIYQRWQDVFNDLGGVIVPFDKSYMRQAAILRMDMTRWNEATLQSIFTVVNATAGKEGSTDVGTIAGQEGFYISAKFDFPYANLPAFSGMPKGYVFKFCFNEEVAFDPLGTQANKRGVVFAAIELWNGSGFDFYTTL